jgi:uncharacterized protein DUF6335
MAKRKSGRRSTARIGARKRTAARTAGKRPKASAKRAAAGSKKSAAGRKRARRPAARKAAARRRPAGRTSQATPAKRPRLDRERRRLDETVPTPPSSLDMDRRGSSVRSGRDEMEDDMRKLGSLTSSGITGGDVDADVEQAYFTGDEAPGGDNPTPDQDIVDDIGRALGVEYQDTEELKTGDKVAERDKHRWELDPASSEDYKDRD